MALTKAEAITELESRGIFVPKEWSAKKVKDLLAEVEDTTPEEVPSVATGEFRNTSVPYYRHSDKKRNSPRG